MHTLEIGFALGFLCACWIWWMVVKAKEEK